MKDAKNAPVENMISVMDTLDSSIAPKKVIQCKATIIPATENFAKVFKEILSLILENFIKPNIKTPAINIRNQTNGIAVMVISFPKIAVNPAMKTST